ncbi:uncharacterized protein LOC100375468 [Saccoglossus kowalevskii]|uniref:Uncharacterized protein LOC100375468 n=1 Tax=Saccoglossus kowalevskii TaxID=10224 RepID=A0ABM0GNB9_SACKO|nr:PREDICTED: uncharacterized protein LOC100375468 [Saccoglossus kowalevskii]
MSFVISNMRFHFPRNPGNLVFLIGSIFTLIVLAVSYRKIDKMVPEVRNVNINKYNDQQSALFSSHTYKDNPPTYMTNYAWAMQKNYLPNFYTRRVFSGTNRWPSDSFYANGSIVFVDNHNSAGGVMKECMSLLAANVSLPKPTLVWNNNVAKFYSEMSGDGSNQLLEKMYLGGFTMGVCDYTNEPCSYFTVIREPYERIIASYVYCKGANELPCLARSAKGKLLTLKEWAMRQGSFFFRQLLHKPDVCSIAYLSTIESFRQPDDPTAATMPCWYRNKLYLDHIMDSQEKLKVLDFVLEHLETWFGVVGITEEYDTFLKLLQHAYKLPFEKICLDTVEQEVFKTEGDYLSQSELLVDLKRELLADQEVFEALYFDIRIYQKIQEIFVSQKQIYFTNVEHQSRVEE